MNTFEHATDDSNSWVLSAEGDNPAGPLFSGGEFAQADIVGSAYRATAASVCSGSHTISCC